MSKQWFVMRAGRIVEGTSGGYYEEETAEMVARGLAEAHPTATYSVMWKRSAYQFPKKTKAK